MTQDVLSTTKLGDLKLFKRGKVRDVYDLDDKLLIISTDRISCFDVVLPSGIPLKGKVLNQISFFWFDFIRDIISSHIITSDINKYPQDIQKYKSQFQGRSMLVEKAKSLPVECVVRGYLSGSGWKEYKNKQSICGVELPAGLKESDRLPEPIFTPSTKEDTGHDMNVTEEYIEKMIGKDATARLKELSLRIYKKASAYAQKRGIIIADTKFEFGIHNDEIILIDEALTPDSSRFWPMDEYRPGASQPSFDKQFVRDYLLTLDWDKTPPGPELPDEIIAKTTQKYLEAYRKLTGKELEG